MAQIHPSYEFLSISVSLPGSISSSSSSLPSVQTTSMPSTYESEINSPISHFQLEMKQNLALQMPTFYPVLNERVSILLENPKFILSFLKDAEDRIVENVEIKDSCSLDLYKKIFSSKLKELEPLDSTFPSDLKLFLGFEVIDPDLIHWKERVNQVLTSYSFNSSFSISLSIHDEMESDQKNPFNTNEPLSPITEFSTSSCATGLSSLSCFPKALSLSSFLSSILSDSIPFLTISQFFLIYRYYCHPTVLFYFLLTSYISHQTSKRHIISLLRRWMSEVPLDFYLYKEITSLFTSFLYYVVKGDLDKEIRKEGEKGIVQLYELLKEESKREKMRRLWKKDKINRKIRNEKDLIKKVEAETEDLSNKTSNKGKLDWKKSFISLLSPSCDILPLSHFNLSPSSTSTFTSNLFNFFQFEPEWIASSLSVNLHQSLLKLCPIELLGQPWDTPSSASSTRILPYIIKEINEFSLRWTAFLLSSSTIHELSLHIHYLLRIAEACLYKGNFISLFAIWHSIQSGPVLRLRPLLSTSSSNELFQGKRWKLLDWVTDLNGRYKNYRLVLSCYLKGQGKMIEEIKRENRRELEIEQNIWMKKIMRNIKKKNEILILPFLGILLSDLTFAEDGNSTFLFSSSSSLMINLEKGKMICQLIDSFYLSIKQPNFPNWYKSMMKEEESASRMSQDWNHWIKENWMTFSSLSDKDLYELSYKFLAPRNN